MEATFYAKRALFNFTRTLSTRNYAKFTTRITNFSFSTSAYYNQPHRDHQSSNSTLAAETTGPPPSIDPTIRQNLYKGKPEILDNDINIEDNSTIDSVSETGKQGAKKAADMAEAVGDASKKTMDTAWSAAKKATEKIRDIVTESNNGNDDDRIDTDKVLDSVDEIDGPVDMAEYRSLDHDVEGKKKV